MNRMLVLGANGALGRHIVQRAISAGFAVSVLVRREANERAFDTRSVTIHRGDLAQMSTEALANLFREYQVVVNAAGYVGEGQQFVDLVDRIVGGLEEIGDANGPVSWFLAGLGLLDIDENGRRGVDLPQIKESYWPHLANYDRIRRTDLDWRILCPGPMVDEEMTGDVGVISTIDRVPMDLPRQMAKLSDFDALRALAPLVSRSVVPYQAAASLVLSNCTPGGEMSRHRVGVALAVKGVAR